MIRDSAYNTEKIYSGVAFTIEFDPRIDADNAELACVLYAEDYLTRVSSFYLHAQVGSLEFELDYEDDHYAFDVTVEYAMPNLEGKSLIEVFDGIKEYHEAVTRDFITLLDITKDFVENNDGVTVTHIVNLPDLARDDA